MILDIGAHSRLIPDFAIFPPGVAMGVCLLKHSIRFTAYSSHPIELKLGRMIHVDPHKHSEPDFSISFHGAPWVRALVIFKSIHSHQFFRD